MYILSSIRNLAISDCALASSTLSSTTSFVVTVRTTCLARSANLRRVG
jgi:hypothetical protein